MASGDFQNLTDAQRETVQALAVLTDQLRSTPGLPAATGAASVDPTASLLAAATTTADASAVVSPAASSLEQALQTTSNVVSDLSQATTANTDALAGVTKQIGGLPDLLAGLAGGLKSGGSLLGSIFGSGFGLASIGLGIAGLFGGGSSSPPPLTTTVEPPSLALEVANTDNILAGFPRAVAGQGSEVRAAQSPTPAAAQTQVTVNVSAMDSQSFLDRSGDIAQAVREAMLYMHPVNDLISEL